MIMPQVLRHNGFRVVIYPNDHLPCHVHIFKGSGEVRINLGGKDTSPTLMTITGQISDKDVVKSLCLVKEHQADLLAQWRKIHE
ncbi:DUF4160 domain-containing protein [Altericista sp. CCNU0014]|uniref:DUF4160 domain-containing protein n=1 Tax=Altericista sp. CCNU0014 TaxID=3082949 RepID=UPI00384E8E12